MNTVVKRDGREVPFDERKIVAAVLAAMMDTDSNRVDNELAASIAQSIASIPGKHTVEDIQDYVEEKLMESDRKDVAKNYILYRAERTRQRNMKNRMIQQVYEKTNGTKIENSNANVDEKTFGGRKNEATSVIQKEIALEMNMNPEVAQAHKNGLIYQHDLDAYNVGMHNCLFIDFKHIFENGFSTRNGDVRSPGSFSTACQLVAVAFQIQSQGQFGGVGSVHIDYDLAPYVRLSLHKHLADGFHYLNGMSSEEAKEKAETYTLAMALAEKLSSAAVSYGLDMLEREGLQATQGLFHNLNTLESRAGSQVPFTSINYGRDTSEEGRAVTRWLLKASLDGIGKHHVTSIFPISIFSLKKGVNMNPGDPNYDLKELAVQSMSKRIYPNFCFGDFSEAHEDPNDIDTLFGTMGCRTMIGFDRNGLGYKRVGRGNNVPITIILPKLGIEYGICLGKRDKPDLEGFWKALDDTLALVEKGFLDRWAVIKRQSPKAAPFMYGNGTIADADKCTDNVEPALCHNTFAFGYLGVAEMCEALFGKNHAESSEVYAFALKVVERINRYAKEFSARNGLNGSCYATPAENLCYTAMKKLQAQYGKIPNVTEREYLTNSHHVPVWEKVSIYDKLRIEAPFCKYATGGCITYIECESTFMQNLKAVEDIIDYAGNLDIPYLAFNFPIDTCLDCGYQGEFDAECPECGGQNILQLRRCTGYLSQDYRNFNEGKQAEVKDRVKHTAYTSFMGGLA